MSWGTYFPSRTTTTTCPAATPGLTSLLGLQGFLQEFEGAGLPGGQPPLTILLQHLEDLRVLSQEVASPLRVHTVGMGGSQE